MRRVLIALVVVAVIAGYLLPFFTGGACTAEFDAVGTLLDRSRQELLTLPQAEEFLKAHGLAFEAISPERCGSLHPRDTVECPSGVLLFGAVPVVNKVCHYYRDDSVRFQLAYNNHEQLIHIQTDMNPYQILKLPFGSYALYVGR
jgi:hypothetical protein